MKIVVSIVVAWLSAGASMGAHAQSATAKIFRCEVDGRVTFSDRPCGGPLDEVAIGPVNTFKAIDSDPSQKPPSTLGVPNANGPKIASGTAGSMAAEQLRQKQQEQQRCQQLSSRLEDLQAKLRSGYTAKQHNSLQQRRRRLEEQIRQSRCR
jgi:hypothetical protein